MVLRRSKRGRQVRRTLTFNVPKSVPGSRLRALACTSARRCSAAWRAMVVRRRAGLPRTPNPINVRPALEPENAVTEAIGSSGGTLEARAADGTRFKLELPASALLGNQQITMTPVKSIDGLAVPSSSFRCRTSRRPASATRPTRSAARSPIATPRRSRSQYEQILSNALNRARADQLLGRKDAGALNDGSAFVRAWWRDVMRPQLVAAETDDRLFERAFAE